MGVSITNDGPDETFPGVFWVVAEGTVDLFVFGCAPRPKDPQANMWRIHVSCTTTDPVRIQWANRATGMVDTQWENEFA